MLFILEYRPGSLFLDEMNELYVNLTKLFEHSYDLNRVPALAVAHSLGNMVRVHHLSIELMLYEIWYVCISLLLICSSFTVQRLRYHVYSLVWYPFICFLAMQRFPVSVSYCLVFDIYQNSFFCIFFAQYLSSNLYLICCSRIC